MLVFGVGSALAGLAGVIAGPSLVTQSDMAALLGPILFVVIVFGGLGSLPGAFIASLVIGLIQTFAVALNGSLAGNSNQYQAGMNLMRAGQYADASTQFRNFADANPKDTDLAPQAIFWVSGQFTPVQRSSGAGW